ncbi:hypothetical protein FH972_009504 [Carpinus fangiana]|uniref:Heterokaryon incompatibility domain-containing protein n=1 Tax=Carpinus fangiana TaxID=176857 RepID=A0A660KMG1_9ROSI|nr:hypothetical protein FH972_009504 [Carpinus fangiana]
MPPASYLTIQELLMRHGVTPRVAQNAAMNELRNWEVDDLSSVFNKIDRKPRSFCPFQDVEDFIRREAKRTRSRKGTMADQDNPVAEYFLKTWPSLFKGKESWLSPPRELIVQAAETKGALCINAAGLWSIQHSNYVAVSHVWMEGLQRSDLHNGVDLKKIQLIFQVLETRNIHAQWIWVDVLVIPGGGGGKLSSADDLLKISIINTLAETYDNADAVIIFDALAWHLRSSDPMDLAVILVCGLWSSRLWTLQEVKTAKSALVITGGPQAVTWGSIVDALAVAKAVDNLRYHKLWLWFAVIGRSDKVSITITDMVMASNLRETGHDLDYARAYFPIMGLKWKQGMTRDQGMQALYFSQLRDATRIMFMFGHSRLATQPTWTPSSLTGLQGIVVEPMQLEARGVRASFLCAKITECGANFRRLGVLAAYFKTEQGEFQCKFSADERPSLLEELKRSIKAGSLHVLLPSGSNFTDSREFAQSALLVAKAETRESDGFECAVFCCVMIMSRGAFSVQSVEMLIRNGDPHDEDLSDEVKYVWHIQKSDEDAAQEGETSLHRAVRDGNMVLLQRLLAEGKKCDELDNTGMGVLHVAAKKGSVEITRLLLDHGADPNGKSTARGQETAVILAAEHDHAEVVKLLAKYGADLEILNEYRMTALSVAALEGSLNAVEALLDLRVDVNCQEDTFQGSPLLTTCSNSYPTVTRVALAATLLDAGAHVNGGKHPSGWTPLHRAAEWSGDDVVSILLAWGADANAQELGNRWTPLKYAIEKAKTEVVRMLIESGAECDITFEGGWTPLHFAASCQDFEITRLLLSKSVSLDNQLAEGGWTPLHIAVKSSNALVVKMLLEAGADASIKLKSGQTPVQVAAPADAEKMNNIFLNNVVQKEISTLRLAGSQ